MVEYEVMEAVTLQVHVRLATEAGGLEVRKALECSEGGQAFVESDGGAGYCGTEGGVRGVGDAIGGGWYQKE